MLHNDDTLKLVETYRKNKYQEKTNGRFISNNQRTKKQSYIIWIMAFSLISYFFVTNLMSIKEKLNETYKAKKQNKEIVVERIPNIESPIIEKKENVTYKNVEAQIKKPTLLIETKNMTDKNQ